MTRTPIEHPALRVALSMPVIALLAYPLATGEVARPLLGTGLLLLLAVLAIVSLLLAGREDGVPRWWPVVATCLGVGALPPLLVEGLAAPVELYSLLFVLVAITGAFTFPTPARTPLLVGTLVVWLWALWWDGLREWDLLVLHVGAGAVIAYSMARTADALEQAADSAASSAQTAQRRAELLSRMLEVHTLERDEVLQTVVDGLQDVGFAAASVRVPAGDALLLAAGVGLGGDLDMEIGVTGELPGRALQRRRIEVIEERERLDELGIEPEAVAAVAVPVEVDGVVEAVVTAATTDGPIQPYQREAVELLASLAGRALRRARLYEADEHTVAELQRLEARTQDFISTVSHELRTPLTVVQGLGQMLHDRWGELEAARRRDLLRRVDANAGRLAEMVRSLLDTSAFEEGRIALEPEPIEVRELLEGLLHRLASVTAAHPVHVRLPERVWVRADRSLIGNVLENLLTNTARHTPQGTRIDLTATVVDGGLVQVAVSDDGPGIPAEDLPHVLDRFYRGGDPTSRPPGGLGLGLALANQILHAHGSHLEISSEEGAGARFAFHLPRAEPPGGD